MKTYSVAEPDVSTAWLAACREMSGNPPVAYHTVVRIADPLKEDPVIHVRGGAILIACRLQRVETVANTIFPAAIAQTSRDHLELARRYLDMLPTLQYLSPKNNHGTYFARLVAFPGADGPVNQLDAIITRLRSETAKKGSGTGPMRSACYEAGFTAPGTDGTSGELEAPISTAVPVRVPGRDKRIRGFPCLSYCSFQLDREGTLHAMAHYRSHLMVERAYGNYVGLGRLLDYIAGQAGLRRGALTITAGYAQLDCRSQVSALLGSVPLVSAVH